MEQAKTLRREMTPAEHALWRALRGNRLGGWHFRRQHVIERWIVDFYCHRAQLVIEVDGEVHDLQPARDAERQARLEGLGLSVMRFTNAEVLGELSEALRRIEAACRAESRCP
jgi:very-short-patch-repair endonuclease